ncbi:MAG TPA: M1 family metallopeptidase [Myxococcaceae bacterium]|nr:M1 family metallopeptidase [Myxococcaceae bacterium]
MAAPASARFDAQGQAIGEPLSDRVASYVIDARLDHAARALTGRETVTWVNKSSEPQATLWFHAYWNAFKNAESTFYRDAQAQDGFRDEVPGWRGRYPRRAPDEWGWMRITRAALLDGTDLLPSLHWQHPDDDNAEDRTVFTLTLPQPVPPGGSVTLELGWQSRIPRVVARAGYSGDYYLFGQWFPKLAVLEVPPTRGATQPRWNAHQYHANSEFYADFGAYDVSLTLPSQFVVGATGVRTGRTDNPDGTVTHRFHQDDVQDFAWTASPSFVEVTDVFREDGLPEVALSVLVEPLYRETAGQVLAALKSSLSHYGRWWMPYPYSHVTAVAPPPSRFNGSVGMEYPTFFTVVSRRDPEKGKDFALWDVTAHEFGHNYFMGLVASNEFEEAWLDEGMTSYATSKLLDAEGVRYDLVDLVGQPARAFFRPFFRSSLDLWDYSGRYAALRWTSPVVREAWKYRTEGDYAVNAYARPMLALRQLELTLGKETFEKVMRTYVQRWVFRHPSTADFFAVAREVSGRDLSGFEQQFFRGTDGLDLAVENIDCRTEPAAAAGVFDDEKGGAEARAWKEPESPDTATVRCVVTVERRAPAALPANVRVTFDDGSVVDETWDGQDTWRTFTYRRTGKGGWVREARIDPGRVDLLDAAKVNDARSTRSTLHPPTAVAGWFFYVAQLCAGLLGAFL